MNLGVSAYGIPYTLPACWLGRVGSAGSPVLLARLPARLPVSFRHHHEPLGVLAMACRCPNLDRNSGLPVVWL